MAKPPQEDELTQGRRFILKFLGAAASAAALAPFAPMGSFLQSAKAEEAPKIKIANVSDPDISTPGSAKLFSYPRPADEDPFSSGVLIHLYPEDAKRVGVEFMAFNRVCVHLRCLYNYNPDRNQHECPCHGSVYRSYDGVPIAGPAFKLKLNPEPEVVLKFEPNGDIYAVDLNGIIGRGRPGGWTSDTLKTPKLNPKTF